MDERGRVHALSLRHASTGVFETSRRAPHGGLPCGAQCLEMRLTIPAGWAGPSAALPAWAVWTCARRRGILGNRLQQARRVAHVLDVAARREGWPGAGRHDHAHAHAGVGLRAGQARRQRLDHPHVGQGLARGWPGGGQGGGGGGEGGGGRQRIDHPHVGRGFARGWPVEGQRDDGCILLVQHSLAHAETPGCCASSLRNILPLGLRGNWSRKNTCFGHLYDVRLALQKAMTSAARRSISLLTTKAVTACPHFGSGRPITAASCTPGQWYRTSSISRG